MPIIGTGAASGFPGAGPHHCGADAADARAAAELDVVACRAFFNSLPGQAILSGLRACDRRPMVPGPGSVRMRCPDNTP
jgi:hypothetical protein